MNSSRKTTEKPAVELCEEAAFLLRHAPAAAWTIYFLGTGPFLLALLYFWTDMTRGVFQETRLIVGSFLLTILFVWMKTCQAMFSSRLWSMLSGVPRAPDTVSRWLAVALGQARIQPWGLLLIPLASILTVPGAWTIAYFQNATALGAGRELHGLSMAQARLWPKQNHVGLAVLAGLGCVVFLDIMIVLLMLPQILITFFGLKEVFQPGAWLALNTTFLTLVCSLTFLVVDPLAKAFYTLRCFYGQSLGTGEDLRARLAMARRIRARAGRYGKVLVAACWLIASVPAAEAPVRPTPEQLDGKIAETLRSSEYNWRFPREVGERTRRGWLHEFFAGIIRWCRDAILAALEWIGEILRRWSERFGRNRPRGDSLFSWPSLQEVLLVLGVGIVVMLIALFLKRRRRPGQPAIYAAVAPAVPDLLDERVSADQLPEDEWLSLAAKLAEQGDLRRAIRALFLSALAGVAGRNWISLGRSKSNRDYERELRRRAAAVPGAAAAFRGLIEIYHRIWYGRHEPTHELFAQCRTNLQALKQ